MPNVAGVRFKRAAKIHYFDAGEIQLEVDNYVVIEDELGTKLGWVVIAPYQVVASELREPLMAILRVAEAEDLEAHRRLEAKAEEALALAKAAVARRGLALKIADAQYTLDGSLLSVAFLAEETVNYREVIRELAQALGCRVRFFQVGPRDEAKLVAVRVAHYGVCGRCLCCASWLAEFPNVSMRVAKLQNLPMDTFKLSGACGRLLCCLTYEYPIYEELRGQLPRVGQMVTTPTGTAKVTGVDILRQRVHLWFDEAKTSLEMTAQQLGYGTLVRPAELAAEEEELVASAAARRAAVDADGGLAPAGRGAERETTEAETRSEAPAERLPRRRRRRRRRGGQ